MKILAAVGVGLLMLAAIATPAFAGVEPSPWEPQINQLDSVANELTAVGFQLDTGAIRMGVEPCPWQPEVNLLDAISTQLDLCYDRVDVALAIAPATDPEVATALEDVSAAAVSVSEAAGALESSLPSECDEALRSVISGADSIIIIAGPVARVADSSDFEVFEDGFNPGAENLGDWGVGDTGGGSVAYANKGRRGLVKFSLAGMGTIESVQLQLTILESRKDQYPDPGTIDSWPPFTNPGLGDTMVVHVADYGTPSQAAYSAASIGNDPGVLIAAGSEPDVVVTIDVTAAVKQAQALGASFVAFRIQTAAETDNDGLNDVWFFASANSPNAAARPVIRVSYR